MPFPSCNVASIGPLRKGHLDQSPVSLVPDKPAKTRREVVYSQVEWTELRNLVTDQEFGDLLDFMWDTGCRPLEARTIEAHHVDLRNDLIVFPLSEAKGRKNERVIFLTPGSRAICERLIQQCSDGPIMRNTKGAAWTKDSTNRRFQRLKKKLGKRASAYGTDSQTQQLTVTLQGA